MSVMASVKTIKPEIHLNSNLKKLIFDFQNAALFHHKDHSVRHNAVQRSNRCILESKFINKIHFFKCHSMLYRERERERERETRCA